MLLHCVVFMSNAPSATKQKPLSELEHQTMSIVWDLEECTIREVCEKMNCQKSLAYTTVATLLNRLFAKGILKRRVQDNIVYFSPKISKKSYGERIANTFFANFFDTFGDTAVASFAQSLEKLPQEKKENILKMLREYEPKK